MDERVIREELAARVEALRADMAALSDDAEQYTDPLRSVQVRMRLIRGHVERGLDELGEPTAAELGGALEALHVLTGVWVTHRQRLVQRRDPWLRFVLHTVDEIAWACLAPLASHGPRVPLAAVASVASPRVFQVDEVFLPPGVSGTRAARQWSRLPVALVEIGGATARLPHHLCAVPHEAGHLLAAGDELAPLADMLKQTDGWEPGQADELFADLFALASIGGAYLAYLGQQREVVRALGHRLTATYPPWERRLGALRWALARRHPASAAVLGRRFGVAPVALPSPVLTVYDALSARAGWTEAREEAAREGDHLERAIEQLQRPHQDVGLDARRDQIAIAGWQAAHHGPGQRLPRMLHTPGGFLGPVGTVEQAAQATADRSPDARSLIHTLTGGPTP